MRPDLSGPDPLSGEELAAWVSDARSRTMELVADLIDDQLVGPQLATVNPLIWEIGHLSWFSERFVLREALQEPPILRQADAIYDSGAIPHVAWLEQSLDDAVAHLGHVRQRRLPQRQLQVSGATGRTGKTRGRRGSSGGPPVAQCK